MLCEEDGRRDSDTEQRIYYFDDVLRPLSFRAGAKMPYEKAGKRNSSTE